MVIQRYLALFGVIMRYSAWGERPRGLGPGHAPRAPARPGNAKVRLDNTFDVLDNTSNVLAKRYLALFGVI